MAAATGTESAGMQALASPRRAPDARRRSGPQPILLRRDADRVRSLVEASPRFYGRSLAADRLPLRVAPILPLDAKAPPPAASPK